MVYEENMARFYLKIFVLGCFGEFRRDGHLYTVSEGNVTIFSLKVSVSGCFGEFRWALCLYRYFKKMWEVSVNSGGTVIFTWYLKTILPDFNQNLAFGMGLSFVSVSAESVAIFQIRISVSGRLGEFRWDSYLYMVSEENVLRFQ